MNKNIRRSIVIGAGVTGAWALGSAVASADEPPAVTVTVPDVSVDTVAGTTDKATGEVTQEVTEEVRDRTTATTAATTKATTAVRTDAEADVQAAATDRDRRSAGRQRGHRCRGRRRLGHPGLRPPGSVTP